MNVLIPKTVEKYNIEKKNKFWIKIFLCSIILYVSKSRNHYLEHHFPSHKKIVYNRYCISFCQIAQIQTLQLIAKRA